MFIFFFIYFIFFLFFFFFFFFFFSSRRRHTISLRDWSSDVCSSDLTARDRARERRLVHQTRARDRQDHFLPAQMLHGVGRGDDRLVLDGRHGHAERVAPVLGRQRRADDREVVRFRPARGENHLVRLGAQHAGDRALGFLDARARGPAEAVRRRG